MSRSDDGKSGSDNGKGPGHIHRKVLDALHAASRRGSTWTEVAPHRVSRDGKSAFACIVGDDVGDHELRAHLRALHDVMAQAHAFTIEDEGLQGAMIPEPDEVEVEAFNEKLLPDPFPAYTLAHRRESGDVLYLCWAGTREHESVGAVDLLRVAQFETAEGTGVVSMFPTITVMERANGDLIARFMREGPGASLVMADNVIVGTPNGIHVEGADGWVDVGDPGAVPPELRGVRIARRLEDPIRGRIKALAECRETGQMDFPDTEFENFDFLTKESISVVRMLAAINAPSNEVEAEPAPKFANRKRREKGFAELKESYSVRIVPRAMAREIAQAEREGRASPRLHWRRAHVRRIPSGGIRLIARQIVGLGGRDASEYGIGPNAYLVGRARGSGATAKGKTADGKAAGKEARP